MSGTQRRAVSTKQIELHAPIAAALPLRSRTLTSEEERVLRARHGASLRASEKLETKADGEVLDELLLIEMELRRRYRAHLALQQASAQPSARKDKIVRALRRK